MLRPKNLQPIDNCRILFRQRPITPTATGRPPRSCAARSNPTRPAASPQLCTWPGALPVASSSLIADISSSRTSLTSRPPYLLRHPIERRRTDAMTPTQIVLRQLRSPLERRLSLTKSLTFHQSSSFVKLKVENSSSNGPVFGGKVTTSRHLATRRIMNRQAASFTQATELARVRSKSFANRKTDSRFRSDRQRPSHAKVLKDGLFGSTTQRRDSTVKP